MCVTCNNRFCGCIIYNCDVTLQISDNSIAYYLSSEGTKMTISLIKSTPRSIQLGTEDVSARALPVSQETLPQHLPLFLMFTEKGKTEPQIASNLGYINRNFGTETLRANGRFYNYQTLFLEQILGLGNAVMIRRMIGAGAVKSFLRLSVEILSDVIPDYERDEVTGGYLRDVDGDIITLGTLNGHRVRWLLNTVVAQDGFGLGGVSVGTLVPTTPGPFSDETSSIYPIMDFQVSSEGLYGDNCGLRIVPGTLANGMVDIASLINTPSLRLNLQVIERDAATQTPVIQKNLSEGTSVTLALESDLFNPTNNLALSINNGFVNRYNRTNEPGLSNMMGTFDQVHVYDAQIEAVIDRLIDSEGTSGEADYLPGESSFDTGNASTSDDFERQGPFALANTANKRTLDFFTGRDAQNVPYFSFVIESGSLAFSQNSNHYAAGGSDGDISLQAFEQQTALEFNNFGEEPEYSMKNFVKYPFSAIWDPGYNETTKYALCNVMSVRRDMIPIFTTHEVYGPSPTIEDPSAWGYLPVKNEEEENVFGEALVTQIRLTPESEYYGTQCFRAMIFGQAGTLISGTWHRKVPLSLQYAASCARFMGGADGKWKKEFNPNVGTNKHITLFKNVSNTFAEEGNQDRAWAGCINKARDFDRVQLFWPAITTVYDDKTSVLFNTNMAWACTTLYKISHKAWQQFVGRDDFTPEQLITNSDRFIDREVSTRGIFADIITTIPQTTISPEDSERGWSWRTIIRVGANNMRLVGVYSIEANRLEDMVA